MAIDTTAPENTIWGNCPNNHYKWRGTCVTNNNIRTITKALNTGESVLQNPHTGRFYLRSEIRKNGGVRLHSYGTISHLLYETAQDFLESVQTKNHKLITYR